MEYICVLHIAHSAHEVTKVEGASGVVTLLDKYSGDLIIIRNSKFQLIMALGVLNSI